MLEVISIGINSKIEIGTQNSFSVHCSFSNTYCTWGCLTGLKSVPSDHCYSRLEPQNPASTRITPTLLHVYVISFKISFETVLGLKRKDWNWIALHYIFLQHKLKTEFLFKKGFSKIFTYCNFYHQQEKTQQFHVYPPSSIHSRAAQWTLTGTDQ